MEKFQGMKLLSFVKIIKRKLGSMVALIYKFWVLEGLGILGLINLLLQSKVQQGLYIFTG